MAEPSLLCVNCASPPPPHRRTWGRCTVCVARNLPSTYYCGEECMNAHWPKHKLYHKEQKERAMEDRAGTVAEHDRSGAEAEAREAERTGDEYLRRCASAMALTSEGDLHAADKALRKIVKQWPDKPVPYHNLAVVLQRSRRILEASQMMLKAMELDEYGTENWAYSAAATFDLLKSPACRQVPKPEWWNDEALKALSARVVVLAPDNHQACNMRAHILSGDSGLPWSVGPRTAAEVKEAATWFRRAASACRTPADERLMEESARLCEEYADPLLANEVAEASKARAAAKADAAEALKVAEAKATAAAEELLAEEEEESQQPIKVSKAKQGKGKNGKGKR